LSPALRVSPQRVQQPVLALRLRWLRWLQAQSQVLPLAWRLAWRQLAFSRLAWQRVWPQV